MAESTPNPTTSPKPAAANKKTVSIDPAAAAAKAPQPPAADTYVEPTYVFDPTNPPDILAPLKSPLSVYQKTYRSVEKTISRDSDAMVSKFKVCSDLMQSRVFELLVKTKGTRHLVIHKNQVEAFKELVKKLLKGTDTKTTTTATPPSESNDKKEESLDQDVLKTIKETTPVLGLTVSEISEESRTPINHRALLSLIEFLGNFENWKNNSNLLVKLPAPYNKLSEALGIPQKLIDASPTSSDALNIGRLYRIFRGSFIISSGEYARDFNHVLIRSDSAFMENVILTHGLSKKIQVNSLYVYNQETSAAASALEVKDTSIIYLEMPLNWVVDALHTCSEEVLNVYNESGDDVI